MITKFIKFCTTHNVAYWQPTVSTLCAYTEALAQQFRSAKSIGNYLSAIKLMHKLAHVNLDSMDSFEMALMVRATKLTLREIPNVRKPVPIQLLHKMCILCYNKGPTADVLRLGLLLAFFGFFRTSNLCPQSQHSFDNTRHLTRGDVKIAAPGLQVALKWSKTLQVALQPKIIPIVRAKEGALDAVQAFQSVLLNIPAEQKAPLLQLPSGKPLTATQLRNFFKCLLRATGQNTKDYSLHALRRGGATESYSGGAHYIDIKRQGAWKSACFWDYVARPAPHQSTVCSALLKAAQKLPKDNSNRH